MALVKLPKNVREIEYQTAAGKVRKYQVRMQRDGVKYNKLFDDLTTARAFALNPAGTPAPTPGQKPVSLTQYARQPSGDPAIDNDPQLRQQYLDAIYKKGMPLKHFLTKFFNEKCQVPADAPWLKQKQMQSMKSFLHTIATTKIHYVNPFLAKLMPGTTNSNIDPERRQVFGELFIPDINHMAINEYIKARKAQGRKDGTILKELSILKKVFHTLRQMNYANAELIKQNPCDTYDKDLLKIPHKTARRITDAEMEQINKGLWSIKNPQIMEVFYLALYTSMRRGEMLNLRKDKIKADHIELTYKDTKTEDPRNVYLTPEAIDLIAEIKRSNYHPEKLFSISFSLFEKAWQRIQHDFSDPERGINLRRVNFHCVRKTSISMLIERLETNSAIMAGTFVGVGNLKRFTDEYLAPAPNHDSEAGILASVGHKRAQTTFNHYFAASRPPRIKPLTGEAPAPTDPAEPLPAPAIAAYNKADWRSLALHQAVAQKLATDPTIIDHARANIARWQAQNDFPQPYLDEWLTLFDQGIPTVLNFLTSTSGDAQRLRSSSPFAGVLTPEERDAILGQFTE